MSEQPVKNGVTARVLVISYVVSALILILDQLTKFWAEQTLTSGELIYVLPFFDLTLVYNEGAAFSLLSTAGGWQRYFLSGLSAIVSLFLIFWIGRQHQPVERMAWVLILGGAAGNLVDRVFYGHVIDFISIHWEQYYWPTFNIADSALTIGAGLLFYEWMVLAPRRERQSRGGAERTEEGKA